MTDNREILKDEFLDRHGWGDSSRQHLAGDASFRSYQRIHRPITIELIEDSDEEIEPFTAETIEFAVLMDAPPPQEDIRPFIYIANKLRDYGLNAPEIIASDKDNGFLLLEDFGDNSYNKILSENATITPTPQAKEIYQLAIDNLIQLHKYSPDDTLPDYNSDLLKKELSLYTDWYLPLTTDKQISEELKDEFLTLWNPLFAIIDELPKVIVLRDYHADNLMWIDSQEGLSKVGILDFQDAVNGSPAYDLVSLLEDARRDIGLEFAQELLDYYLQNNASLESELLNRSYSILGAQRNIKILGIFARLSVRDKKTEYLKFIPRVLEYLKHDLNHPDLANIKQFIDSNFNNGEVKAYA